MYIVFINSPDLRLWAGLEFSMGFIWKWKDDSEYDEFGTVQWAGKFDSNTQNQMLNNTFL